MIDRNRLEKPTAGACCRCGKPLVGDDIFHWSPGSWSVWCFPCYKTEHFHNLTRIQERNKEPKSDGIRRLPPIPPGEPETRLSGYWKQMWHGGWGVVIDDGGLAFAGTEIDVRSKDGRTQIRRLLCLVVQTNGEEIWTVR